jgi:hypothetical protein
MAVAPTGLRGLSDSLTLWRSAPGAGGEEIEKPDMMTLTHHAGTCAHCMVIRFKSTVRR